MDSHYSHEAFAEKLGLNFPLLSDYNREVVPKYVGYYPTMGPGYKQVGRRAVFVIDRSEIISYRWISEDEPGKIPNVNEVFQAAQSTRDSVSD